MGKSFAFILPAIMITVFSGTAIAGSIQIRCAEDGRLAHVKANGQPVILEKLQKTRSCQPSKILQAKAEELGEISEHFSNIGADEDGEEKIDSIKLISLNGLNKKKTDLYDRSALKEIIRHAIAGGIDPYLALSIAVIEADPHSLVARIRKSTRDMGFGPIHVSAIAAYTAMGCLPAGRDDYRMLKPDQVKLLTQKMKDSENADGPEDFDKLEEEIKASYPPNTPEATQLAAEIKMLKQGSEKGLIRGVLRSPRQPSTFDLTGLTKNKDESEPVEFRICSTEGGATINSPKIKSVAEGNVSTNPCCANVKANGQGPAAEYALKGQLAVTYLKGKVQDCLQKGGKSVSYCIQSFNGLGYLGEIRNQCLSGIDMSEKPVYGARVADWMTNSLMSNDEINQMIAIEAADLNKPVQSLFCIKQSGSRTLDSNQFLNEQRRYLIGKPDCGRFFR